VAPLAQLLNLSYELPNLSALGQHPFTYIRVLTPDFFRELLALDLAMQNRVDGVLMILVPDMRIEPEVLIPFLEDSEYNLRVLFLTERSVDVPELFYRPGRLVDMWEYTNDAWQ